MVDNHLLRSTPDNLALVQSCTGNYFLEMCIMASFRFNLFLVSSMVFGPPSLGEGASADHVYEATFCPQPPAISPT